MPFPMQNNQQGGHQHTRFPINNQQTTVIGNQPPHMEFNNGPQEFQMIMHMQHMGNTNNNNNNSNNTRPRNLVNIPMIHNDNSRMMLHHHNNMHNQGSGSHMHMQNDFMGNQQRGQKRSCKCFILGIILSTVLT